MGSGRRLVGNLPAEPGRLVGRRAELAETARLLRRSRLVTVTGVGGVGKTRLARRAAGELQPHFAEGAWWVELFVLSEGRAPPYAIGEALPLADQTTRPMIEVVAEYVAGREMLLVWDTCEHLADECREAAADLLTVAPDLRILATSRRPLGLPAEEVFTLDPLPVPAADDEAAGGSEDSDAVVLLAERAARAVPGFTVTSANRAEVAALCRRLEGLPLALELAAARLDEMPVAELNQRLADRYAILGDTEGEECEVEPSPNPRLLPGTSAGRFSQNRERPPWHRALRTTIGWSHELCSPLERLLWARASVFAGCFDAETAREVCADEHLPGHEIPRLLAGLAAKSLLVWAPTGAAERYRMLDTIREFGAHWLRGLGEEEALRRRHRQHYLALARAGEAAWLGPGQFAWYDRMSAEHSDVRAAMEYCLAEPEGHAALELAGSLWFFWYGCGVLREGRLFLDRALAADTAPSRARAKALYVSGPVLVYLGDLPALEERAAELAALAAHFGETERTYAAATGLRVSALRGDLEETVSGAEALLATDWRERPLTLIPLAALVLGTHSLVAAGRFEEAVAWLDELSDACDRDGERSMRAWGDFVRSQAELALGRFHEAHEHARAALLVKHRLRDGVGSALALETLARAALSTDRSTEAAWLLGLAGQMWETLGRPQAGVPPMVAAHQVCERQTRAALGDHAYETAYRAGHDTDLDTGIARALTPPGPRGRPGRAWMI